MNNPIIWSVTAIFIMVVIPVMLGEINGYRLRLREKAKKDISHYLKCFKDSRGDPMALHAFDEIVRLYERYRFDLNRFGYRNLWEIRAEAIRSLERNIAIVTTDDANLRATLAYLQGQGTCLSIPDQKMFDKSLWGSSQNLLRLKGDLDVLNSRLWINENTTTVVHTVQA